MARACVHEMSERSNAVPTAGSASRRSAGRGGTQGHPNGWRARRARRDHPEEDIGAICECEIYRNVLELGYIHDGRTIDEGRSIRQAASLYSPDILPLDPTSVR